MEWSRIFFFFLVFYHFCTEFWVSGSFFGHFFGNGSERGQSEKLLHERIVFLGEIGLAWLGQDRPWAMIGRVS